MTVSFYQRKSALVYEFALGFQISSVHQIVPGVDGGCESENFP